MVFIPHIVYAAAWPRKATNGIASFTLKNIRSMKTKHLVFSAIALGAAVALLLTTDKGKEWRDDLVDNADEWRKKLKKLARTAGSELSDLRERVSAELDGVSGEARKRIQQILDEAGDVSEKAKNRAKQQLN